MFGLINRAIADHILREFGEERWREVAELAGIPDEPIISMERYPDEVTYRLVQAASTHLGVESADIMRLVGRHWMLYTAEVGYGELLRGAGRTIAEFVGNLNTLHTRVQLSLPHLVPPSITLENIADSSMMVHYRSTRRGLTPLALGILEGLGTRFGLRLNITYECLELPVGEHTVFTLRW